jgi:hypothetical protein
VNVNDVDLEVMRSWSIIHYYVSDEPISSVFMVVVLRQEGGILHKVGQRVLGIASIHERANGNQRGTDGSSLREDMKGLRTVTDCSGFCRNSSDFVGFLTL